MSDKKKGIHHLEWSAIWTVAGILALFAASVGVTLIAPQYIDPSWKQASSTYQEQMYEVMDPNVYVSTSNPGGWGLQYVYHLKQGYTLAAFQENETVRITSSADLAPYITKLTDPVLKLTSRVLLLRKIQDREKERALQKELQRNWVAQHPDWEAKQESYPHFEFLELYDPGKTEAFAVTETDGVIENWAGASFELLDANPPYSIEKGAVYVNNPKEYRISEIDNFGTSYWLYDENGEPLSNLYELQAGKLRFLSRETLIQMGESIYRIEGCWYCHTDQTRTLVQDTILNGGAEYPAPPSSANEYVYQKVTFPGTRRIGPDLSRVGIKRPHRDWHMSHFWLPKLQSRGSVMPSFKHFFDNDPSGSFQNPYGVPNYKFEAIFQYLMTKGTRITPPDQAWWLGKDPIQTLEIIEGAK